MTEVWIVFKKGLPMEVHLSEEMANKHRFHRETVEHFIHVGRAADNASTREQQLEHANALLQGQIADLTEQLQKAERRMGLLEKLLDVPVLMRKRRAA